jgi:DNA-directed RNA polymerase specialized sigma24 family protein
MSTAVEVSEPGPGDGSTVQRASEARFTEWFERDYPRIVGVARQVLDAEGTTPASLRLAEELTVEAFSRLRWTRRRDDAATTALLRRTLDGCMDALVGHPGMLTVHPELLGPDMDPGPTLRVAELHGALATMRAPDRHVGLLALAGGYAPSSVAALLLRPLDEVLERLARVGTRISDGRRLGLSAPSGPVEQ